MFYFCSLTDLILDYNDLSDVPALYAFRNLRKISVAHNHLSNDCSFVQEDMRNYIIKNVSIGLRVFYKNRAKKFEKA